ncbi:MULTISPECIES: 30S ribosomal protein S6e [Methanothermobacter]|mgnify:FL=1|uniref:Small ribosomal subunit protein eS6 n=2 Tax=Methanothermobacter TaxID=145260 RepID=RS6E_METTH|nr:MULTISPECIES: 30S ribosomal protein S6e [Methanothermobacter]O26360.1 RecName: Full=Small ribosomal subunit protein eS6; AltName: Full=30S ribosomal protein S6e [Methanothermobacter thermautotrophicus str. Delta H]MBC7111057.1 30S ribosomal protein S6e [Methanothermobacter sp.]AAB84766.1 ribosomal protein S6 [Methanothermobacter thermautotrophicus str. Delta H]MDI6818495.1 30S ribosomal protein S6e [Methanothermobacter thermautotrophicus]MDK2874751.1 small subunit ribosomal protein S6e [Met
MAFKVVISDKEKSVQMEVDPSESRGLIGLTIGDEFDGSIIGLSGYKLKITGGSDKNGFPMKKTVPGARRIRSLVSGGVGYKPRRDGERRRKTFRGNTISDDIVQINTVVIEKGEKPLEELLGADEE